MPQWLHNDVFRRWYDWLKFGLRLEGNGRGQSGPMVDTKSLRVCANSCANLLLSILIHSSFNPSYIKKYILLMFAQRLVNIARQFSTMPGTTSDLPRILIARALPPGANDLISKASKEFNIRVIPGWRETLSWLSSSDFWIFALLSTVKALTVKATPLLESLELSKH